MAKKTKNQCGNIFDTTFSNIEEVNKFYKFEIESEPEATNAILIEFDEEERYGEKYVVESKKLIPTYYLTIDINDNFYLVGN